MNKGELDRGWQDAAVSVGVAKRLLDRPPGLLRAALALTQKGLRREAEAAYRELLRLAPGDRVALLNLVNLLLIQGRQDDAAIWRRRLVELEVEALGLPPEAKAEALAFRLAAARLGPPPDRAPAAYVARSFDRYAEAYEAHLRDTLGSCGPEPILALVARALGGDASPRDILDLGCGTGLAAPLLRPLARRLDGVDLSPAMLDRARGKGLYDRLEVGDLAEVPPHRAAAYDLVLALEVLNYLGDLAPALAAIAASLRPGGLCALTIEGGPESGYRLANTGRFAHAPGYLREAALAAGLVEVCRAEDVVLRREQSRPVVGHAFVLRRG